MKPIRILLVGALTALSLNVAIDAEWFGDGKWQINDELLGIEEEDWEVWADWFS